MKQYSIMKGYDEMGMHYQSFKLHQVKPDRTREFAFMGLDFMKQINVPLKRENYGMVFESCLPKTDEMEMLETLFELFNVDYPAGYKGRSMSVSDVVEFDNGSESKFFFCDSFGWTEIEF